MRRTALAVLAIGGLSLGGCGTFSDKMCGPVTDDVYYRGVRLDVMAVKEGGAHVFMAADLPFSAVIDTLLVPYLAYHEWTDPPRKSKEARIQSLLDEPAPTEADLQPQSSPKR